MKDVALQAYHARMHRVLDYIDSHLDEELSLETLSQIAAFSKFHFHRQFASLFGLSLNRYIQLLRLKRASYRLAFRDDCNIIQIAFDSGYLAPEAFSRAFKQRVGQTPSQFRDTPDWVPWQEAFAPIALVRSHQMSKTFNLNDVTIVDFPATTVAILQHRGDPAQLNTSIERFIAWRKQEGLPPSKNATYTILHDDPETTMPSDYRTDLCVATDRPIATNQYGIIAGEIPSGQCAVYRVKGSGADLKAAIMNLYADWLPQSGHIPRDYPVFVQRLSLFPDLPEHEVELDLFVPLAS